MDNIQEMVGKLFRHYKGNIYRVIGIGKSAVDESTQVMYTRAGNDDPTIWIRPLQEWHEDVSTKDCSKLPRFTELKE